MTTHVPMSIAYDQPAGEPMAPIAQVRISTNLYQMAGISGKQAPEYETPALLDTGAALTVIPRKVMNAIEEGMGKVHLYNGRRIINTIDGKTALRETYSLRVASQRKGPFPRWIDVECVVSDHIEWAILGRNFLNEFSIVFDGPAKVWQCIPTQAQPGD